MAEFKIVSSFTPKGDQPSAIDEITSSLNANEPYTTLLGITGSGKTLPAEFSINYFAEKGKKVIYTKLIIHY